MPIYKPSELRAFLDRLHVRPNKKLSQNFLIDGNVLDKIIVQAGVVLGDTVVEIGPGPGALTERLLACGSTLIAIEKDPVFAESLTRFSSDKLKVICDDALDCDIEQLLQQILTHNQKAKVVANLPYHITSELLQKCVKLSDYVSSCTVMVQEDAAKRFIEKKGPGSFGFFSLFLQYHAKILLAFRVSAKSFYPAPSVDSCVLHLILQKQYPVDNEAHFFSLLQQAFSQRRKTLVTSLRKHVSQEIIERALEHSNKKKTTRPEEFTLEDWVHFYTIIKKYPAK